MLIRLPAPPDSLIWSQTQHCSWYPADVPHTQPQALADRLTACSRPCSVLTSSNGMGYLFSKKLIPSAAKSLALLISQLLPHHLFCKTMIVHAGCPGQHLGKCPRRAPEMLLRGGHGPDPAAAGHLAAAPWQLPGALPAGSFGRPQRSFSSSFSRSLQQHPGAPEIILPKDEHEHENTDMCVSMSN